ncbi:MAG: GvpL/GvpF family gas vesicle protein [Bryobacterales bacterium]|nr:GvpL/GvpF family gas vesicle protein [Bryobacterales bacterium]
MAGSETAIYLYCLGPSERLPPVAAAGVDERSGVSLWFCDEIGALLSEVPLDSFRGEQAEARLQELSWLGPRVCRHEAVIEEAMRHGPVLPARFATLFASADSLRAFVLRHRSAIAEFFSEIGAQQEWAVKGLLVRARARETMRAAGRTAAEEASPQTASPGARYFAQKRIDAGLDRQLSLWLKETGRRAAEELRAPAGGFRERKVVGLEAVEDGAQAVWNWAFLVPPAALADFRERIEGLNSEHAAFGLSLRMAGPFPPYSFAPALSAGAQP